MKTLTQPGRGRGRARAAMVAGGRGVGRWLVGVGAVLLLATAMPGAVVQPGAAADEPRRGFVISVEGEIDDVLKRSVERRVAQAREAGATVLIFSLDTPGGLVTSALEMCRLVKSVPESIHTVAWVRPQAYSAGAMIAMACDEIVMSPSSMIGDCAPILMSPVGPEGEMSDRLAAKVESPILQEFRDSAQRNGYDLLLSRAMVKWEEEVWWIENTATGERRFVNAEEKRRLIDGAAAAAPRQAEAAEGDGAADEEADAPAGEALEAGGGSWRLVESFVDPVTGEPRPVENPVDRRDSLLTMSQSDAVAFGFARAIVTDEAELARYLSLAEPPTVLEVSGWEQFAQWLNSPLVRGMLFVIVLAGAYIEFQSPGLIIPGLTALVALGVFLGAPYAAGLANIWTIVLLVAGLVLLAVEVFVLPGFGVAGVSGIVLLAIAFVGTFVPEEPGGDGWSLPVLQGTWDAIKTGIIVMFTSTVVAMIGILLLARYLPETPLGRRLILANPPASDYGASAAATLPAQVGEVGVVTADLRPGGQARFGDRIVEVSSQGQYVEAGRRVQVLEIDGLRLVVRPVDGEE